jgi:hypothetical protein
MQREVLAVTERLSGASDPRTLTALAWLGNTLSKQGKYDQAASMERQVLAGRTRVSGAQHPDTLAAGACLGSTLFRAGAHRMVGDGAHWTPASLLALCAQNTLMMARVRNDAGSCSRLSSAAASENRKRSDAGFLSFFFLFWPANIDVLFTRHLPANLRTTLRRRVCVGAGVSPVWYENTRLQSSSNGCSGSRWKCLDQTTRTHSEHLLGSAPVSLSLESP